MAFPSRRNSGLKHRRKCLPHFLLLCFSSSGLTMFSVVPGVTVLFTTIRWVSFFFLSALPISLAVWRMNLRFMLPFGFEGVPTVMKDIFVCRIASSLVRTAFSCAFLMVFWRSFWRFGS